MYQEETSSTSLSYIREASFNIFSRMQSNYIDFRVNNLDTYKIFNPVSSELIYRICNSDIFPSGIIVTGSIGVGKSTFAEVLTNNFYNDKNLHNKLVITIDTPVDNSAQYCRDILQKTIKIKQVYNKRVFVILDEAHMLSFAAQQVFLSSLERENNITIIFITNDIYKICDALQNRCLTIEISAFSNKEYINEFAKFVISKIKNPSKQIIDNYDKLISSSIFKISGRDIINAIIYGNFEEFDDINTNKLDLNTLEKYVDNKIKVNNKINIENILEIISNILLSENCYCKQISYECKTCKRLNIFIRLHSFVINNRSLKMLIRLLYA